MIDKKSPLLVALDYNNINDTLRFIDQIDPKQCRLKIGQIMFTLFGPSILKILHDKGFEVFLDLKFYDIPNTIEYAVAAVADLGVWMVNIHASGGIRMMHAARKPLISLGRNAPLLVAVTILTSIGKKDLQELGVNLTPLQQAEYLAKLAYECGLDGVVCSAQEAIRLREQTSKDFLIVTPGIRPICNYNINRYVDDQRRTVTPQQAKQAGVDYMIIGRPITQSFNPNATLQMILNSLSNDN